MPLLCQPSNSGRSDIWKFQAVAFQAASYLEMLCVCFYLWNFLSSCRLPAIKLKSNYVCQCIWYILETSLSASKLFKTQAASKKQHQVATYKWPGTQSLLSLPFIATLAGPQTISRFSNKGADTATRHVSEQVNHSFLLSSLSSLKISPVETSLVSCEDIGQ